MIKLLVMSTIKMTEEYLWWYAERNCSQAESLKPHEFVKKIKDGERVVIKFPDDTATSYELVIDNN